MNDASGNFAEVTICQNFYMELARKQIRQKTK